MTFDKTRASVTGQFTLSSPLSAELALAAACVLWPHSERRIAAIHRASRETIDWPRFIRTVARHGVVGMAHDGLRRAGAAGPAEALEALGRQASAVARRNLAMAAEAIRLHRTFSDANLPVAFLKGLPLAMLAYGTIALRPCRDLDVLVPEARVLEAAALLERSGYRRTEPGPAIGAQQIATWMRTRKDFTYFHDEWRIIVELHWRLTDNPLLQNVIHEPATWAEVPIAAGVTLPTLAMDDLLVYLTMHGAHHGWARMKWVADLAALLAAEPDRANLLLALAERRDVGRGAAQLLVISHALFATNLPARWAANRSEERIVRWLARTALAVMMRGGGTTEPHERVFGAARISLSRFLMKRDWRFKRAQLGCALTSGDDWQLVKLPRSLQPLYRLLRLPLWLGRRISWARGARRRFAHAAGQAQSNSEP